ncbi:MAG: beta-ketoacyl-[acyl-carrier-protein] synthase family protein [Rhodocyclaceae bacterium]|nr:MAG: beta-ketoacyl-[acyl-carrier-protein] synthase family protein [Rhodocyclaceae bacterium]
MTSARYYLPAMGLINALGHTRHGVSSALFSSDTSGMLLENGWLEGRAARVGRVQVPLPPVPDALEPLASRTNQLLLAALAEIKIAVEAALTKYGRSRIAVIIGTSNSGIEEGTNAIARVGTGNLVDSAYHYEQQELGTPALFLARHLGVTGPAYSISTACTSSAKVFSAGSRLLQAGICDAVILGGSDALAKLTVSGFTALESTDIALTNPMSRNRKGINIGEGAALFLLNKEESAIQLLGVGESSDAHHISAPHPEGLGAELAMKAALSSANLENNDVDYLNLHGTATPKNDEMESLAVARVFPEGVPASSTKPMTGHLLGAAGASEVALCWLALQDGRLPPHCWDRKYDEALPRLSLVELGQRFGRGSGRVCMSNSFAFGGNNASVLIGDAR